MLESELKAQQGSFPNIIYKRRLAPLPLFKQNQPLKPNFPESARAEKSFFGFHTSSAKSLSGSPTKTFQNEFKTVNNYGRLCDQPFLEFSTFHFEQVFGSTGGKKKIMLEPIEKKKQKQVMNRLATIRDYSEYMRASAIRSEDALRFSLSPKVFRPQEVRQAEKQAEKQKKVKENLTVIKKVYHLGEFEADVGFYSLEVVVTPQEGDNKAPMSIRIGKSDLKRIYKDTPTQMMKAVLESIHLKDGKIKVEITKEKEKDAKSGASISEEAYPEKKDNLVVTLNGHNYKVAIYYPYLQISIDKLDYKEKIMLKPLNLSNLYEEKFNNLKDYIQRFNIPSQVYKTKKELHQEELRKLPSIIKKVIKTSEFGGLMLFKSLEVHLKNTSEVEPETMMHESSFTPMARNIMKRKKKDVNNVVLRLDIADLDKIDKCNEQELVDLIKESVVVEEEKGFVIKFTDENINPFLNRKEGVQKDYPEVSEKFQIRFNKFLYEGHIKFPTLELYVPETNFKDVIQLSSAQLGDLIDNKFNNMIDYLQYFKKPPMAPSVTENETTEEAPKIEIEEEQGIQEVQEAAENEENAKGLSPTAESTELP